MDSDSAYGYLTVSTFEMHGICNFCVSWNLLHLSARASIAIHAVTYFYWNPSWILSLWLRMQPLEWCANGSNSVLNHQYLCAIPFACTCTCYHVTSIYLLFCLVFSFWHFHFRMIFNPFIRNVVSIFFKFEMFTFRFWVFWRKKPGIVFIYFPLEIHLIVWAIHCCFFVLILGLKSVKHQKTYGNPWQFWISYTQFTINHFQFP